jgi:hypothetical protein
LARAFVLRFGLVYWGLFCIVILGTQTRLDYFDRTVAAAQTAISVWIGEAVLGIAHVSTAQNGSGDRTADWVYLLFCAAVALIGATVWTLLDRRRAHDDRLREILHVLLRYTLGFVILGYGVSKMLLGQFPPPSPGRLLQRYGDSSPMGLMWTFMGASPAYVFFSGLMETLGAMLLFWRRTTTLGALVLVAVMANIVLLNFCYDVPVKINSSHYLAMALVLLLPMLRRLADVVVMNRATQPVPPEPVRSKRARVIRLVSKYLVTGFVVIMTVKYAVAAARGRGNDSESWYGGYWTVEKFTRDGQEVPAVATSNSRWSRLRFQTVPDHLFVRWRFMDDSAGDLYSVVLDETARTLTLTYDLERNDPDKPHPTEPIVFHYTRVDADHVTLDGKIGPEHLVVELARTRTETMLLVTRGFHWISEEPFNR